MRCSVSSVNATDDREPRHPMNWMGHALPEWFDLDGRLAIIEHYRPTQPGVVLASAAIEVAARLAGDLVVADERAYAVRSL
jgi:hypothetical protein